MRKSTFIGWISAYGGSPLANSRAVIPRDHMSGLVVISALLDNLRCHPKRRPHERILLGHGRRELPGDAKVREFDLAVSREEDVGRYR